VSRFQSPVYPTHQQRDRAVADQIRPADPVTCDDCARPWQPGAVFWRRASRPAWIYCRRCRSDQDTGQGDWEPIDEADMAQMAREGHEAAGEPVDASAGGICGAVSKAADRVLREAGPAHPWNHISAEQRKEAEARIQSEKAEGKPMGKMSEEGRRNFSEGMTGVDDETRELAAQQGNGHTQETNPETPAKTAVPVRQPVIRTVAEPTASDVLTAVATLRRLDAEARRAAVELIG